MEAIWSGGYRQPVSGSSTTTSGTTLNSNTSSDPVQLERRPLLVEENAEEGLDQERTVQLIKALVEEFCAGANGKVTAPDRWISELNVAWIIHLVKIDASGRGIYISRRQPQQLQHLVQSWIPALGAIISTSIRTCFSGFCSHQEDEASVELPAASGFVRFAKATLLKMLSFVDALVGCRGGAVEKLRALLQVRDALSTALEQIMVQQSSTARITDHLGLGGLLSAEVGKLDQAIRNTTEQIRTVVMASVDDDASWGTTQTLLSSADIHEVTRSVISSIKVLTADWWSTDAIIISKAVPSANYAPHYGHMSSLIMKLVYSLEEKLARVSQSFPDQSLRFIFLINNSYFIRQELMTIWTLDTHLTCFLINLAPKINIYIKNYLKVSWEPVLKCLHNRTIHCCFTKKPQLPMFESKFQATNDAQKLWKVPEPELRKRLREAIIEMVVSGFTEYLEDNNRSTLGVTPQELEDMLQELFEG